MKLKFIGPAAALLLLVGGVGVSANSGNGIPEQLTKLQAALSSLAEDVTALLPLKDDVISVKDELITVNSTISKQQNEINLLKEEIVALKSTSQESVKEISPEVKQSILYEARNIVFQAGLSYWDNEKQQQIRYNTTNVDVVEQNGKLILKVYTEGNYDWSQTIVEWANGPGPISERGRALAENIIIYMDRTSKLYNVDLDYEFYQNGEKVQFAPASPPLTRP